jgi:hypothetical protein
MTTVLEECNTGEQLYVVRFLWPKELSAKDIHKEIIPVYCGKCLSRKAVHNWVEKRGNRFADDEKIETEVGEVAETRAKRLLCRGFRRTHKAIGQVYQCWWRVCREIIFFFQVRISHVLHFISICDLFTDFPSNNVWTMHINS